jgi:hypothetical protein
MKEIANYCFNLNIIDIFSTNSRKPIENILKSNAVKTRILPSIQSILSSSTSDVKRELSLLKKEITNKMKVKVTLLRTVMMKKP